MHRLIAVVLLISLELLTFSMGENAALTLEGLLSQHCSQRSAGSEDPSLRHRNTDQQKDLTAIEELVEARIRQVANQIYAGDCLNVSPLAAKIENTTGGVYNLYNILGYAAIEVYCDMVTDGGGWIVIQRRTDGSANFLRNWKAYVEGFGERQGEFWLGLDIIHHITRSGQYELRVDMIERNGTFFYAKYESFAVGDESDNYRLQVSGYSGNATDSLSFHDGMQFSTKDRDHDLDTGGSCASYYTGAWWYNACYYSSLNGIYSESGQNGIVWWNKVSPSGWDEPSTRMVMMFAEMKIRRKL